MTFTDVALEKFYLFAKLLLRQLPYDIQTLPLEVVEMIDMDKYRVQEEQNGRITLADEDATLEPTTDDGHRGKQEEEKELLTLIVQKLNEDFGIPFEEADRVINAIKQKLDGDDALRAAFKTNSIEFLRRQKLQDNGLSLCMRLIIAMVAGETGGRPFGLDLRVQYELNAL